MRFRLCLAALALATLAAPGAAAQALPEPLVDGVEVRLVRDLPTATLRIAHDPSSGALYALTFGGDLYRIAPPYATSAAVPVASAATHGASARTLGLAVATDGTVYLSGNDRTDTHALVRIVRGRETGGVWAWETVAETVPYPRSGTAFDHDPSAITISDDGASLFVSFGSRTGHGEVQDNDGAFPGLREIPLTSAILRIPADATDLALPNDEAALRALGVFFADGFRNPFDSALDPDGELFVADNAGDRDDPDEINWVREGLHYGFPWVIGGNLTPQQFPGYDPDDDPLVSPESYAYVNGFFYDDPTYPAPPAGVSFAEAVRNLGPDADLFRDETTGEIRDASATAIGIASLTPHRSPLGLVFDRAGALPEPYTRDGFVLSYTAPTNPLLAPFGDEGEDLLHLTMSPDRGTMQSVRLARGFSGPVDAVLLGETLYVAEFAATRLVAVEIGTPIPTEPPPEGVPGLTVWPNPAADRLRVTGVGSSLPIRLTIVDALGRTVRVAHDAPLAGPLSVDIRALAPGPYVIRLEGGKAVPFIIAR